jgi:hypothetical protein
MTGTTTRALAVACASLVLLAGCGSQSGSAASDANSGSTSGSEKTHTMSDGTSMTDAEMKEMAKSGDSHEHADDDAEDESAPGSVTHRQDGPSQPAGMICSLEIAQAVQRTFALRKVPTATDSWADSTYTCDYQLPTSVLRLSVKDLDEATAGRAYFDALGRKLPGAHSIRGLQNLGFPALETPGSTGAVAFLKDHKTLWVDASRVAARDLPPGFNRTGAAYGVAAAVIACWTE